MLKLVLIVGQKPTDYRRLGKLLLILLAVYVVAIILSKALGLKSNTPPSSNSSTSVAETSQYAETHQKCGDAENRKFIFINARNGCLGQIRKRTCYCHIQA